MINFPARPKTKTVDRIRLNPERDKPLVSVIIPCYNHAQFVGEAIQSVLDQDYQHYEIILVDDGSTDNASDVVAQFGFKVRYIYQQNQGLSAARNTGLRAARGELIGFLDSDDLYEPNYLSSLVAVLAANPQADAVHCACRFVDIYNHPLSQIAGRVIPPDRLYSTLLKSNFITPLCMLAYCYCYRQVGGFDTNLTSCEDWDMWLRISKNFNVISTAQVLARYRVNPSSMSTVSERMLVNRLSVLRKNIGKDCSKTSRLNGDELEAYSRAYLTATIEYLQSGDQGQAYLCFTQALQLYPSLVEQRDIFFELAWGCTTRGYRGDFIALDLRYNAQVLLKMLDKVFSDVHISPDLIKYESEAYSNAFLVLSQLNYGKGNCQKTRKYWLRAVRRNLPAALSKPYFLIFVKSLLGLNTINQVRGWKLRIRDLNVFGLREPEIGGR